jgi:hypothetical protein
MEIHVFLVICLECMSNMSRLFLNMLRFPRYLYASAMKLFVSWTPIFLLRFHEWFLVT